jgi:hypothetical protein
VIHSLDRLTRAAAPGALGALGALDRRPRPDDGRAIIEFVVLGLLLLLPLTYLVLMVARVQAASFSASLAGREAGRAFVTAASDDDGFTRANAAASLAFADFDFDEGSTMTVTCDGSPCLRPGGVITSTATIEVALPLVPDFIAAHVPASVTISSTHVATVDRFAAQ